MCDESGAGVEFGYGRVDPTAVPHDFHVLAEEFLEGSCAQAALEPGAVWGKSVVQLCHIAREAKDQVSGRMSERTVVAVYPTRPSILPDGIEDLVRGDLVIPLRYIEPKAIEVERLRVVLVGQPGDRRIQSFVYLLHAIVVAQRYVGGWLRKETTGLIIPIQRLFPSSSTKLSVR